MKCKRIFAMIAMVSLVLEGCSKGNVNSTMQDDAGENTEKSETEVITSLSRIDNSKWNYNESDGVYWQVGISYCEHPAAEEYEILGVFVPDA
ncbi:hypothetical protein [Faecalicatena contorta]|uniref:hypothetical protein n=1 Tax=Faecalicatena contorta TaxID=39482 RepID=UPI001F45737B|nr:hypothetical protein [Faecalicatena contorta]MCF2683709.1 hypothetical protein [Faecalicatena contorta]